MNSAQAKALCARLNALKMPSDEKLTGLLKLCVEQKAVLVVVNDPGCWHTLVVDPAMSVHDMLTILAHTRLQKSPKTDEN